MTSRPDFPREEYDVNINDINGAVESFAMSKDTGTVKSFALRRSGWWLVGIMRILTNK